MLLVTSSTRAAVRYARLNLEVSEGVGLASVHVLDGVGVESKGPPHEQDQEVSGSEYWQCSLISGNSSVNSGAIAMTDC
eukprot:913095-Pyramimonas_sp.AAC.1